jgi:hypothetical protein
MKPPRILKVVRSRLYRGHAGTAEGYVYYVFFTTHHAKKIPEWLAVWMIYRMQKDEDNPRHSYIQVLATDELQAAMRFNRLWSGLIGPEIEKANT